MRSVNPRPPQGLGKVQVHTQVDVKADQIPRARGETVRAGQTTDRAESTCRGKLYNACVHAGLDTVVVGADDDASRLERILRRAIFGL